jgi:hypothetical protein
VFCQLKPWRTVNIYVTICVPSILRNCKDHKNNRIIRNYYYSTGAFQWIMFWPQLNFSAIFVQIPYWQEVAPTILTGLLMHISSNIQIHNIWFTSHSLEQSGLTWWCRYISDLLISCRFSNEPEANSVISWYAATRESRPEHLQTEDRLS